MSAPRVVLADDEVALRRELATLLREEGIDVVAETGDGAEAVSAVLRLRPDALVMDLRMPLLDGIDATRAIRAAGVEVRVVLLSAYGDEALRRQAAEAGADAYLVKGCPADEVLDQVTAVRAR